MKNTPQNFSAQNAGTESNSESNADERGRGIDVRVKSEYLPTQSSPHESRYVFAYHVTITNTGKKNARLLTRHWVIVDGNERMQEVRGDGVIGEQPLLAPGTTYHYSSGTVLETPVGSMHGEYGMVSDAGEHFDANIPAFTLAVPRVLH